MTVATRPNRQELFAPAACACCAVPVGLDHLWRRLTTTRSYSPKVWNDAYLAGFAMAGGLTVVTFDRGFGSIPDLNLQLLHG